MNDELVIYECPEHRQPIELPPYHMVPECPVCGQPMMETGRSYSAEPYEGEEPDVK